MKDRIKQLRKTLDLTQQEFADRIGIKRNSYANYEIGRNIPLDAVIKSICREFDVNENWLRTGEGEMFKNSPASELDALAEKYNLGDMAMALIKRFVTLRPEEQEVIINFVQSAAAEMAKSAPAATADRKLTIDERLEIIKRQMELEEKAEAESSASPGTGQGEKTRKII